MLLLPVVAAHDCLLRSNIAKLRKMAGKPHAYASYDMASGVRCPRVLVR